MLSTKTFGIWLTYYIELSILHFQIKQKRAIKQSYAKDRKEVTRINTWSLQRSSVVTEMARLNAESVSSVFLPPTRPHICHGYHGLYLWRKNCHVEKLQLSIYDNCGEIENFSTCGEISVQGHHQLSGKSDENKSF